MMTYASAASAARLVTLRTDTSRIAADVDRPVIEVRRGGFGIPRGKISSRKPLRYMAKMVG